MSARIALVGVLLGVVACGGASNETTQEAEGAQHVAGAAPLVPVDAEGTNIPARYVPLLDAIGLHYFNDGEVGCSVTHVGGGLVLAAGHCILEPGTNDEYRGPLLRDIACDGVTVKWGVRGDKAPYLTSRCERVLAVQRDDDADFSIFRVSPAPDARIPMNTATRPAIGTTVTLFGHPGGRPLEWSQRCSLLDSSTDSEPTKIAARLFKHGCNTENHDSGAAVLDDDSLMVVGIHDGSVNKMNFGTYLLDTEAPAYAAAASSPPPSTPAEHPWWE